MALVPVLAHLTRGEDPVGDAEIDDLHHRRLAARDGAEARLEAFARHQGHELRPDGVRARAGARAADHGRRIDRRRRRRSAAPGGGSSAARAGDARGRAAPRRREPAPRRTRSRTTPRYPNRNRLGETSPRATRLKSTLAMKVLAGSRPRHGASMKSGDRSPPAGMQRSVTGFPAGLPRLLRPLVRGRGALDPRARRRRGRSRRHRAGGLPGGPPPDGRLRRRSTRPAGSTASPAGRCAISAAAAGSSTSSPGGGSRIRTRSDQRRRRSGRRARAQGGAAGPARPSWGRSARSGGRRSCCSRSRGSRATRSPGSRAFRSTPSGRASTTRARSSWRWPTKFREAQLRARAREELGGRAR